MENFVEQLAIRQVAAGHDVRVATLDRIFDDQTHRNLPAREQYKGIDVFRTSFIGSPRYPIAPGVAKALQGADIVHVHGVDFFADFLAATRAVHRKAMVLTTHGGFFHTDFARALKELYLRTITRASLSQFGAVIACSTEDQRLFADVAGERLVLISNPVDIDKFERVADAASDTIIYFGRLAPNKEVTRLIDWFASLARIDPASRLIVAGKPMGVDADELRRQAADLGLGDRFELHVSPSDEELRDLIARSGSYACASSYEGFGLAAVEAASAGLFPVLSDIPPFADTLGRLGYGLTVDFADPSTWEASHSAFLHGRARFREEIGPEQVRAAVSPFDWNSAVPLFDQVYRKVLGRASRRIGPVEVDVLDRDAAVKRILSAVERREPALVTFCNAHTVNLARRDNEFQQILSRFLILNDGVGVDLASQGLFGQAFPDNLNGTDFTPYLLAAARRPLKLFLVGSKPGVAEGAARNLEARYPHLKVVGCRDGFFPPQAEGALADAIRMSGADLILAAMGQPRQETWATRTAEAVGRPILCVGALLDFLSEEMPRAPDLLRRLRLEWAFRLIQEPRRLAGRYIVGNATFLAGTIRQILTGTRI